ncbi:MAG: PAS domain-containing protein [Bryobacteraceae bacterium]
MQLERALDFRDLFKALPGLYLVLLPNDPTYTIVAANDAYVKATLVDPDQIVGRGLFDVFPDNPGDPHASGVQNLRASLRQVFATKAAHTMRAQQYDIRRPKSQGGGFEERYWSPVNSPLLGDDGEVRFIIHRVEDVTELIRLKRIEDERGKLTDQLRTHAERMEAELFLRARQLSESQRLLNERRMVEEMLRASEARFSMAFAQAPIGMVLLTPEGRFLDVNQAYVSMLGYTPEELASHDSSFFTHPEDIALTRCFFASLQAGPHNSGSIEKRYFRKNGEVVWTKASAAMRRDDAGRPSQVVAIVEDITARKRAEARYRFLAESIPQTVWTAAPDGTLDYVNGRGTAYFGVPQEAVLAAGWLAWVHPDERESVEESWKQSLQTGTPYEAAARLKRGSDGSWRFHLVRALPLAGDDGALAQWFGTCTDIEDRKQVEAKLHQQWHTFNTALSNTPDFVYTFDLEGRFTYVNRALLSLWQKSLEEALAKNFFDLEYPAELAARLQSQIQQVIDTLQPVRDQTPFTGPTGETRYYDYIFVPVLDGNGRVRAVAGTTRDNTEQNRAAQQIEADRRRWRELLVQTPAAIAVLRGPDHIFEWVNPEYARLVGRPAETLVGQPVLRAIPEAETQIYAGLLNGVFRTGEPFVGHESLVRLNRREGLEDFYINFVYLPTRNAVGEIDGIFVHVTDVTDMVLARKRVEESEAQFRTLAETIPHLAWMADQTGNRFWYNRRWYDYTGMTFDEVKDWGWQKVHDPAVLPVVLTQWREALSSGQPFEIVHPLRRSDGTFRSFLTRMEPIKDVQGRVVRWFGTNTDITDQRRTEQELRRMNRELEEFAFVASHDLQEPLRMVNIYTQLILKTVGPENAQLAQYSRFVQQGVTRMEALIHDLLLFSRTVQSEVITVGTADLSAACNDALSVLKNRIEETGAVIKADPLPEVRGETAQLAQVFQNVLSNALKYRKKGMAPEVYVSAKLHGEQWTISIRDNGIGFEPQYSERIFGLFKRLHKDEYPGTGLGLAICTRIVERYGGRMWADGRPGQGATFHFTLPRVDPK